MKSLNSLWTCPNCGRKFTNKNQWHSCTTFNDEDFLKGKTERALVLYNKFVKTLRLIGEFSYSPAKTRIAFQRRIRIGAINRIGRDFISGHLLLTKNHKSKKFCTYFTPRDMARLGYLYMNNGNINGNQIVPAEWVEQSITNYTNFSLSSLGIFKKLITHVAQYYQNVVILSRSG